MKGFSVSQSASDALRKEVNTTLHYVIKKKEMILKQPHESHHTIQRNKPGDSLQENTSNKPNIFCGFNTDMISLTYRQELLSGGLDKSVPSLVLHQELYIRVNMKG